MSQYLGEFEEEKCIHVSQVSSFRHYRCITVGSRVYYVGGVLTATKQASALKRTGDCISWSAEDGTLWPTSPCLEMFGCQMLFRTCANLISQRCSPAVCLFDPLMPSDFQTCSDATWKLPERSKAIYALGGRNAYLQHRTIERYNLGEDRWVEVKTQLLETFDKCEISAC